MNFRTRTDVGGPAGPASVLTKAGLRALTAEGSSLSPLRPLAASEILKFSHPHENLQTRYSQARKLPISGDIYSKKAAIIVKLPQSKGHRAFRVVVNAAAWYKRHCRERRGGNEYNFFVASESAYALAFSEIPRTDRDKEE